MKKVCTLILIQLLLVSAAFGQDTKPKKKWAVGVYGGPTVLLGSLNSSGKYLNGFDAGILGQKAFSDVLSLRVDLGYSQYKGYDDIATVGDKLVFTQFANLANGYYNTNSFVLNHNTTMYYGDVVMVLNLPIHTLFGKEKGKFNWYVFAGAGFNANKVMGDGLDASGNPYTGFSGYEQGKQIPWSTTKEILDGDFETDLRGADKYIEVGDEMELRPEFVGGTGVEWAFNDVWEVFAEGRFVSPYNDRGVDGVVNDNSGSPGGLDILFTGRVGLKWRFHTKDENAIDWFSNTAAMQYNRTLAVEDKIANVYSDTDGDGVPDYLDKEPNTPSGASVDGSGRSLDADYDGVPDYADDDLFTVKGSEVDDNGRGVDTDGDGVPDGIDLEPNTPKGKLVNFQGIAIDDVVKPAATIPSIFFDYNSSDLRPEYLSSLASIIATMKDKPNAKVIIIGHTDYVGSEKFNNELGLKRANAIKDLLVQAGVSSDRIVTDSKGKVEPIADGKYKVSSMMNRRAEIKIVE